ncbi:MAG: transcriptional repressor LexA [Pirellulaceae bacterium]|nr:transcriptional repressor LexA [Planctomycetales bacterium]MCA9162912.1 transcriptional repressor LexA [Planctomycetales bacterium]
MLKLPLTERQKEVLDMIYEKMTKRGYGPTVREIGEEFGITSPNGVMCHLRALERKGFIRRSPNKSRAIELTDKARRSEKGLPLVGSVAAGLTNLAFSQADRIDFGEVFSGPDLFVLEVRGDSMVDAHIDDGDFVVIRRQKEANKGDMVVAQTDEGEATLKYWFPERKRIRLQPANKSMQPIYVDNAEVMGVVVGVVRNMR